MQYSKLKNEIEMLELKHKHDMQLLKMQHEQDVKELKSKCTHTYDDGTSAKTWQGVQWDYYYNCAICNKTIS